VNSKAKNFCKFRPLQFIASADKKPRYAPANMPKSDWYSFIKIRETITKNDGMMAENKIIKMR
jgi:hypothetical protein